ncbi:hypothetical protein PAHAL_3G328000 [Panicum hallii]|uniref:Uncharacterized protein n=1 Tax=Panicum hallii TaxID=206008 RepID=A0A2T8KKA6_9POAL|nr:hypothetical protein PAHAL_3G328000 [Panicum hallii]
MSSTTTEQRDAHNKHRREAYARKRQQNSDAKSCDLENTLLDLSTPSDSIIQTVSEVTAPTEDMDLDENCDWLHTNPSYDRGGVRVPDTTTGHELHH